MLPGDKRMLLLRKEVSVSTSHVLEKLCAAHRKWRQNRKPLLGETIWSNISWIFRFHQNLKSWANFNEKNTFPSLRPHDKNLGPTRTFAVRRLRGSPLACTVARYLIRVLTGARRKRIGLSLKKNYWRHEKSYIFQLACFLQTTSGRRKNVAFKKQRTENDFEISNPSSERPSGAIFHQFSDFIKISNPGRISTKKHFSEFAASWQKPWPS